MYPPVYVLPREAIEDVTIGGYDVPKGATIQVALYVTQHDPRWFPDPECFRPSRFDDEALLGAIVGFRLHIERVDTKLKFSQNRSAEDRDRVIAALRGEGHPEATATAAWMESYARDG